MIEGALWRKWTFYYLPLILFVFVLLFPFYWMIITSFRPDGELYRPWNAANYMPFWTNHPTFDHFRYLFEETDFGRWMLNTMFIAITSTLISLFCGVLAGYALARLNFPFAGSLGTMIFITYLVPQTLLFIPLAQIIRNFHLGDTPWSLILTYPTFLIPFCTWLMMGYFKAIPKELEECARIDGASRWMQFLHITLPMLGPVLLVVGVITVSGYFQLFAEPYVMTRGDPLQRTVSVLYFMFEAGFKWWNLGRASAVAFLLFLIILAVTTVMLRFGRKRQLV